MSNPSQQVFKSNQPLRSIVGVTSSNTMSDSQARAAYEYRAFLLQVSEGLTQEDCQKIVFLEELPPELENKPPLNVLIQLEMHGKLSASRPDDLAKLLKRIPRHDLAKKVREFVKQQRKGRAALSPLQRIDHPALKLSASLEVTLLQCKILLEQVENLREEAEEAGYKRVEEVVADAQAMISEHVKRKFLYASKLIPQEAEGREQAICSDRDRRGSTPSFPDSPLSSLEFDTPPPQFPLQPLQPVGGIRLPMATHTDMHASELKAAVENRHIKSQSLSRSSKATGSPAKQLQNTKQPLVPPTSQRQVKAYDTTPPSPGCRVAGSSMSSSASPTASALAGARQVIPGAEQAVLGTTQLVTGRLTPKPTPPPKPKFKKVTSQQVEDNDYEDLTTSTYTGGDSGFAESSNFLKVSLSDQQESHDHDQESAQAPYSSGQPGAEESSDGGYAPLNMEAVHAGYYKSLHRQGIQEVQYAPQVAPQTHPSVQYVNFSQKRK